MNYKGKVSKAQQDVWDWRKTLYKKIKGMKSGEALKYLVDQGAKTAAAYNLKVSEDKPKYGR